VGHVIRGPIIGQAGKRESSGEKRGKTVGRDVRPGYVPDHQINITGGQIYRHGGGGGGGGGGGVETRKLGRPLSKVTPDRQQGTIVASQKKALVGSIM